MYVLTFKTMQEACRASVSGVRDSVILALRGEAAKPEFFGNVSDAAARASHLNTIGLLASKANASQRNALEKAVITAPCSTYQDFKDLVKLACTADASAPISTGKGASRQATANVVAPTAKKVEAAVKVITAKKAEKKAAKKAEAQPQAQPTKEAEVPAEVMATNRMQFMTALAAVERIAGSCQWDVAMTEKARQGLAMQIDLLRQVGDHIRN